MQTHGAVSIPPLQSTAHIVQERCLTLLHIDNIGVTFYFIMVIENFKIYDSPHITFDLTVISQLKY